MVDQAIHLPAFIQVTPHTFEIIMSNEEVNRISVEDGVGDSYGFTDYKSAKIYLRTDLPLALTRSTMIHEIFHAIWWVEGVRALASKDNAQEEDFIQMLDNAWLDVLQRNPLLITYLTDNMEEAPF